MINSWAPSPDPRLSQGDVRTMVPIAPVLHPLSTLGKKNAGLWEQLSDWSEDRDGMSHCLARGKRPSVIVVSHSCELDKPQRKSRVLVAPVNLATTLDAKQKEVIFAQKRISLMPLPDVPSLGDCYADLRSIMSVDRSFLDEAARVGVLSDDWVLRLQAQLVAFFSRKADAAE